MTRTEKDAAIRAGVTLVAAHLTREELRQLADTIARRTKMATRRNRMKTLLRRFVAEEDATEPLEYAIMSLLIATALIVAVGALSTAISDRLSGLGTTVEGP